MKINKIRFAKVFVGTVYANKIKITENSIIAL